MGQNADSKSPAEIEANNLQLAGALRDAYQSGNLTDEQATLIRKAGIAGSGWDQPNRGRMDGLLDGVGGDRARARDVIEEWQGMNEGLSLGGPDFGGSPTGPFVPNPDFNPDDQPRVPLEGGDPRDPYAGRGGGGGSGIQFGGGGVTGVDPGIELPGGSDGAWNNVTFEGFNPSQNRDAYNMQSQAMMAQAMRNDYRENHARGQAKEAANVPREEFKADWEWANLPDVSAVELDDAGAYQWDWNSAFGDVNRGETSNSELFNKAAPLMSAANAEIMQNHLNNPNVDPQSVQWSKFTTPSDWQAHLGKAEPGRNAEFTGALTDMYNQFFTRTDLATPVGGGPSAAPGYAMPI